ncbi:MAG: hypothetical protein OEM15_09750 [Myxococcales bacterium]|nr:hypothetical protein [Myxococcales bacterium]MDH3483080.1 hypothetical protein [Myxococcales bacterium]
MSNKVPEDELRRIISEYRHTQGEHEREGESGSWRRRQKAQLADLETRFEQILEHWFRDETTRAQWREHLFRAAPEPAPVHEVPRLYRGRSESGSVMDVFETQGGDWEYIVDGTVAKRSKAGKSTEATLRLGGPTFQETFDAPTEALEVLRTYVAEQPSGGPPWEWASELFADGLIDMNFSLTERGQRFIQS